MATLRATEPEVHDRPEVEWAAAEETFAGDCCRQCGHRGHRAPDRAPCPTIAAELEAGAR